MTRTTIAAAWLILLVALFHSTMPSVCLFREATSIACPGCGLSTSLGLALRGSIDAAREAHPFGAPLLALAIVIDTASLSPGGRAKLAEVARHRLTQVAYAASVGAFIAHGVLRSLAHLFLARA